MKNMKSIKTIIAAVVIVGIVGILAIFGGVFGNYSDERNELIGFVAEDGTLLDLDGNPVDEQPVYYSDDESDDAQFLTPEEIEAGYTYDELVARAIREEEELKANPPKFDITAGEVHEIIDSLNATNQFALIFDPGDAQGEVLVGSISLIINSDNPLADAELMYDVGQIGTAISEQLGFVYPREEMEKIMHSVVNGEVHVDEVRYEDIVSFTFGTHHEIYMLSISKRK